MLYGDEWQRALARGLGPYHPARAREAIDDSLIRKWTRGARPIPDWVAAALRTLLLAAVDQAAGTVQRMRDLAERLAGPSPDPMTGRPGIAKRAPDPA